MATFDRLFAANVRAPYFLVAALAPKMAARGSGSIINIGSQAGQIGMPSGAAYGGTKDALASMTRPPRGGRRDRHLHSLSGTPPVPGTVAAALGYWSIWRLGWPRASRTQEIAPPLARPRRDELSGDLPK